MAGERGRPRKFDREEALTQAMEVFWLYGYQNASLSRLTSAMGINKPSLYAAFGDKTSLYLQALKHYLEREALTHIEILHSTSDVLLGIRQFLYSCARALTCPDRPAGCFVVTGTGDCGCTDTPEEIQLALKTAIINWRSLVEDRLEQGKAMGQLASDQDVTVLSQYLSVLLSGIAVQARMGASLEEVLDVIELGFSGMPLLAVHENS